MVPKVPSSSDSLSLSSLVFIQLIIQLVFIGALNHKLVFIGALNSQNDPLSLSPGS